MKYTGVQARGRSELPVYCVKHKNYHANYMDMYYITPVSRLHARVTWKGQFDFFTP